MQEVRNNFQFYNRERCTMLKQLAELKFPSRREGRKRQERKTGNCRHYHVAKGEGLLGIDTSSFRIIMHNLCFLASSFGTQANEPIKGDSTVTDSIKYGAISSSRLLNSKCEHAWQVRDMRNICHLEPWSWNWNRSSPHNSCISKVTIDQRLVQRITHWKTLQFLSSDKQATYLKYTLTWTKLQYMILRREKECDPYLTKWIGYIRSKNHSSQSLLLPEPVIYWGRKEAQLSKPKPAR